MNAISPELALVDPELAVAARALLPGPGQFRPASRPSNVRPVVALAPVVRAPVAQAPVATVSDPPPSLPPATVSAPARRRPSRRRFPRREAIIVSIACGAVVTAGSLVFDAINPRLKVASGENPRVVPQGVLHDRATHQSEIARTYTWPAVPGARAYRIELVQDGRLIYAATTNNPSLELPAWLHLAPGRYTWTATPKLKRPGSAARPIVEETFRVSPS